MNHSKILSSKILRFWWKGNKIIHMYLKQIIMVHVHSIKNHNHHQNREWLCSPLYNWHLMKYIKIGGKLSNFMDELKSEYLNVSICIPSEMYQWDIEIFPNLTCFHCSQVPQPAWLSLCPPCWDSVLSQMKYSTRILSFQNGNLSCSGWDPLKSHLKKLKWKRKTPLRGNRL